jgi:hypothetical protein
MIFEQLFNFIIFSVYSVHQFFFILKESSDIPRKIFNFVNQRGKIFRNGFEN